ncbi:MAG: SUMF1/EgtB/PvdO family nonheme iron enzyme [Myxococcota bacterium]
MRTPRTLVLLAALAAVALVACDDPAPSEHAVGPEGALVEVAPATGPTIRVEVPPGALAHTIDLTAAERPERRGEDLPVAGPESGQAEVALELGPPGTEFTEPVTVEVDLPEPATPRSLRGVYLWDEASGSWVRARQSDGSAVVGVVSADGTRVTFTTDHFSTYAVSIEEILCKPLVQVDVPLVVPCTLFNESVFSGPGTELVLLSAGARTRAYRHALLELVLRTERPRSVAEKRLTERFLDRTEEVMNQQGTGYASALKVFDWMSLMAEDALQTGTPAVYGYERSMTQLAEGGEVIGEAGAKLSTGLDIAGCVVDGMSRMWALGEVDYARARERFEAIRGHLEGSKLHAEDAAFREAVAEVDAEIASLSTSVAAQTGNTVDQLATSDCGLAALEEAIDWVTAPLLAAAGSTGAGLAAKVIYDYVIKDIVLNDMVKSTQQGLALAALGSMYTYGDLYPAIEAGAAVGASASAWSNPDQREVILAGQVGNYAILSIRELSAEILRQADAGLLNKGLTKLVDATSGALGYATREEIAQAVEKDVPAYDSEDEAIAGLYADPCDQPGASELILCGAAPPCLPSCAGRECGGDGCGGVCGPGCGAAEACDDATGQCQEAPPTCEVVAPSPGSTVSGDFVVEVSAESAVPLSSLAMVVADGGGSPVYDEHTQLAQERTATWASAEIDTSSWADGSYEVVVKLTSFSPNDGGCESAFSFAAGCEPACSGVECGPDGCDGVCGPGCGEDDVCEVGVCVPGVCEPECSGKCGGEPDGCGSECPDPCEADEGCDAGVCTPDCVSDCSGLECGGDGCGGSCGTCGAGENCDAGTCVETTSGCWPDCGEMVEVPGGPFMMGCNEAVDDVCGGADPPYWAEDEAPQHEVFVPGFEIDVTEVTNASYAEFLNAHGNDCDGEKCVDSDTSSLRLEQSGSVWAPSAGYGDHPVVEVTWYGASGYCQWSGKRLCTESEWEKAARGTEGRKYPWGNEEATCEYAVMDDDAAGGAGCGEGYQTWPVGSKPAGASPYGALDMAGNVWEWVQDRDHSSYEGAPTDGSAWEEGSSSNRVGRGGGFHNSAANVRAGSRAGISPGNSYYYGGFRCCREDPDPGS